MTTVPDISARISGTWTSQQAGRILALTLACIAVNGATGLTLGSFGVLMPGLQNQFATTTAVISLSLSFILLMMGILAPVIAIIMDKISIRFTMVLGAALISAGFVTIAFGNHLLLFLISYLCLIGPGVALLGFIPATTLVSNWHTEKKGLALGIVTMPLGVLLAPIGIGYLNAEAGIRTSYIVMAIIAACIGLLMFAVRDRPFSETADVRLAAPLTGKAASEPGFSRKQFLMHCLGLGLMVFPGTMAMAYMVIISGEFGISPAKGAILMSLQGGAGMVGAIFFGFLSDHFGPARSLVLNALVHSVAWGLLTMQPTFGTFLLMASIVGGCSGGIMATFSTFLVDRYGVTKFSRLIGLASFLVIPFTFGAAPLAGYIYEETGSFFWPALLNIAFLVAVSAIFSLKKIQVKTIEK